MGEWSVQGPHISVVVPTRNRPDDVRRCLENLCAVQYPHWDVVLVDQSDDERTRVVAGQFAVGLPRLSYQHMHDKGASRARNRGIEQSDGEIVAFLDDDCTVPPDWLRQVADVFRRHPEAAVVFGHVASPPHDPQEHFVPVFPVRQEQVVRGRRAFIRPDGMSASMYMRRDAVRRVGMFDVQLGPGTAFAHGGEDNDYIYRCLVSGCSVVKTPAIVTTHHGLRDYQSGAAARIFQGYAYCAGATDLKLLRCGELVALVVMASHIAFFLLRANWLNLILRRGPSNAERIVHYARGALASLAYGVDRRQCLFMSPAPLDLLKVMP